MRSGTGPTIFMSATRATLRAADDSAATYTFADGTYTETLKHGFGAPIEEMEKTQR
jgi:hypothetical protein